MDVATFGLLAARAVDLGDERLEQCLIPASDIKRKQKIGQ
jgi:hypothetical protein